jgi:hypothetical protein
VSISGNNSEREIRRDSVHTVTKGREESGQSSVHSLPILQDNVKLLKQKKKKGENIPKYTTARIN